MPLGCSKNMEAMNGYPLKCVWGAFSDSLEDWVAVKDHCWVDLAQLLLG